MNARTIEKRHRCRLYRAKLAVINEGSSLRLAASRFHIPESTLFDHIRKTEERFRLGRPTALTNEEEKAVVGTILYYADRGMPMRRSRVAEVIALLVETLSEERKNALPFRDGVPGRNFLRGFIKRHRQSLRVCVPEYHEAKRHAAMSAETLTSHIAKEERLVQMYNIDASRFWNLDEAGAHRAETREGSLSSRACCAVTARTRLASLNSSAQTASR